MARRSRQQAALDEDDENDVSRDSISPPAEGPNKSRNTSEGPESDESPLAPEFVRLGNKYVRMALFAEHSRQSIRRATLTKEFKTLTTDMPRDTYKRVFSYAQGRLRREFGMKMIPLPARKYPEEMIDLTDAINSASSSSRKNAKREAQDEAASTDSKNHVYILRSVQPQPLRKLVADAVPNFEAVYMGYVFMICSTIILGPNGCVRKSKLLYDFQAINRDMLASILARMVRHNYLLIKKTKPGPDQDELYCLGPRARAELTADSIMQGVAAVLGDTSAFAMEDVEKRVKEADLVS